MSRIIACFRSRCRLHVPVTRAYNFKGELYCSRTCAEAHQEEVETQPHQIYRPRFISIEKLMKRPANMLQFMEAGEGLKLHHHE